MKVIFIDEINEMLESQVYTDLVMLVIVQRHQIWVLFAKIMRTIIKMMLFTSEYIEFIHFQFLVLT